jgi:hypothetical protein
MTLLLRPNSVQKNVAATFTIDFDELAALPKVPAGYYKNTNNWKEVTIKVKHSASGQRKDIRYEVPSTAGTLLTSDTARAGVWGILSIMIRDFDRGEIFLKAEDIPNVANYNFFVVSAASHGDLIVPAGQMATIPSNGSHQYGDLIIEAGGTLKVNDGGGILDIEVLGNCVINGTILAKQGKHTGGAFTKISPLGETLTHLVIQKAGGNGGAGEDFEGPGGTGGLSGFGNGGGGGRSAKFIAENGEAAIDVEAGSGAGASIKANEYGEDGPDSTAAVYAGGGGFRGAHGQSIYIKAPQIQGSGIIDASGQQGGQGGDGGEYLSEGDLYANGAGGGGAGGDGGKVWLRAKKGTPALTINVAGGEKGARGLSSPGSTEADHGENGIAGAYNFSTF